MKKLIKNHTVKISENGVPGMFLEQFETIPLQKTVNFMQNLDGSDSQNVPGNSFKPFP